MRKNELRWEILIDDEFGYSENGKKEEVCYNLDDAKLNQDLAIYRAN